MDTLQKSYPDIKTAEQLLAWADRQNSGPWADHSRVAARAARTIAQACALDGEKAYVLGLLHDIGRYEGVRHLHHVYAGYDFMTRQAYPDSADICLTHSFPLPDINAYGGGEQDCTPDEMAFITDFLQTHIYNDYDRLIQLCDCLSLPEGVCLMDIRLLNVARRYGCNALSQSRWDAFFNIKKYFDEKCGMNIYDLFYDEIRQISFN